jgi:hypothetical protein
MKLGQVKHQFVQYIPSALESGVVYVSIEYGTAVHSCCCGCGSRVVTPITPTDWVLIFNGETISLDPSIGNWNFPCRSHYFIRNNRVVWAADMTQREIESGRQRDVINKRIFFGRRPKPE